MGNFIAWFKERWGWLKDNHAPTMVIIAVLAFLSGTYFNCRQVNDKAETYALKRPNIKIKTPYLKAYPYATSDGGKSIAIRFFIPICNEGGVTAYNVEIKRKELELVRGPFTLDDSSLKSEYTCAPFDLKPKDMIQDTIFIDETPEGMQKVATGEKSFLLKYEIRFYADKNLKSEPFIYQYDVAYSKGKFEGGSVHERLHQDIKP